MLSGRSDALNLQSYKSSPNWFVTNVALQLELLDVLTSDFSSPINLDTSLISEALDKVKALNIIKVYTTSETESDRADHYTLMEIVYN